ncbi:amidohydrolase [Rudanella paleaurantiibacter]|uniref:Omega-amidase YafV n=1 Tax=Rudanella paleaurantiibacter TaxID=2614655 RepID=A0A7J5U1I6_9BACT|nr:amidohydrolase [Rudanella paleaurantiibacter]KAB7730460.1 amidohydrolase [Rudanella paleaurantiibacter]
MNVTLLQTSLHWHDPVANRAALEETIFGLPQPTDLIVLPEMFTTGFTMEAPAVAEAPRLTTHRWMQQMAAQTNAAVTGSYVVRDNGQYVNRLLWMEPDGQFATYDKRHLFRMAGEDKLYTAGESRLIRTWRGWRICPLICYDLRFPVWSRNTPQAYDLLLYVANWPAVRQQPWDTLLQARAIENLSYVIGVNRVGDDVNGHHYAGGSAIINPKGEVLFRQYETPTAHQQTLSFDELNEFRAKFPAHLDADEFVINNG